MQKVRISILAGLFLFSFANQALALGFQAAFNGGLENPNKGETRVSAPFIQGQLATLTRVFRLQTSFTALSGSNFFEAEGGVGVSLYPVSQLVSERAPLHPFLVAAGTLAVGTLKKESRVNTGYLYGAGVDMMMWRNSGLTFSVQQHNAKEKSIRYSLGIFWFHQE